MIKTSIAVLFICIAASILISESIGGWTRKYTSPVHFDKTIDLTGKVAIVTGGNAGIGFHTALQLAHQGAHVIATSRSLSRGKDALERMQYELGEEKKGNVQFLPLDLASLDSVQEFAREFRQLELPLHILVLNAGVMKSPGAAFVGQAMNYGFETTRDGFEQHIGVNHVAHAYLTKLLEEPLQKSAPSRVVFVSSVAEVNAYPAGMVFSDWVPTNERMPASYEDGAAYGQSKLANLLYANELASRWNGTGVTAYSLHPGVIRTELTRYMEPVLQEQLQSTPLWLRPVHYLLVGLFSSAMMSPPDGALTQLYLATAPEPDLESGAFYHPVGKKVTAQHAQANNRELQMLLWEETEKAIKQRGEYRGL